MLISMLKIMFKGALKNKYSTLLNVFGLSVGIACSIMLLSWVKNELTYDHFFKNGTNIFRINTSSTKDNVTSKGPWSYLGLGPEALATFPEVKNFVRLVEKPKRACKVGDNLFYIDNGYAADSTFFSVFSYEAVAGDLSQSLNKKDQIVIDEYLANKCFGSKSALGEIVKISNRDFVVSAVIKNVPKNSHLQFHFLIPMLNQPPQWLESKWDSDNCFQYLVLGDNVNTQKLGAKLTHLLYSKNEIWKEFKVSLILQPLIDIHFGKGFNADKAATGNRQNVYILMAIAFFVLLIACINFINIFVSTSLKRTKSTGVKMVSGASRASVFGEFSIEVLILVLTSFVISIVIVKLTLPYFNTILGSQIAIQLWSTDFLFIAIPVIFLTILLAGFFPSFYISRFNPVLILKGGNSGISGKKNTFQRSLATIQFVIATVLIISVIVIQKQVNFLKTKSLGFDKENLIYVNTVGQFRSGQNIKVMKEELSRNKNILGITSQNSLPSVFFNGGNMSVKEAPDKKVHGEMVDISENYFDVMKMQFLEGSQDFNYSNDSITSCIINEAAAKQLNLKPPYTGQMVFCYNANAYLTITGVVNDVYSKSLNQDVMPCLYTKSGNYENDGVILFRINGNYESAISAIKDYWNKTNSSFPFEYNFLDEVYDGLYKNEISTQKLLSWFTILSIILTCMGLLAMTYFITESRTKEIGVRKINGAKTAEVLSMLNMDIVKWIALAYIIAAPLAYYAMNKWLQNFAFKTELSWWIFVLAGLIVLGVALLTVSWQSWKAATRNPVEALRYE